MNRIMIAKELVKLAKVMTAMSHTGLSGWISGIAASLRENVKKSHHYADTNDAEAFERDITPIIKGLESLVAHAKNIDRKYDFMMTSDEIFEALDG